MPYQFSYFAGGHDGSHSRHEARDANGRVYGHYTLATAEGSQRVVCYVADENGFRAWVDTNEQGTANDDPADVSIRSTAPGTGGTVPRGPIQGICGRPPPPAQTVVTSPPVVVRPPHRQPSYVPAQEVVVVPPSKPAYVPEHHISVVPPPRQPAYVPVQQVTVVPPPPRQPSYVPVQEVVVHPPAVKHVYVPPPVHKTPYFPVQDTYVEPPRVSVHVPPQGYVRKVIVKRPPPVRETYLVPQPPKTHYVPVEQVVVRPPPVVHRHPPRRPGYVPAREEPERPVQTYYDAPKPRPVQAPSYVPSHHVYRPPVQDVYVPWAQKSSCSGYCGPKVTAQVIPSEPSYVKTSTGPVSYSVKRGYLPSRYEPWAEPSYKRYETWRTEPSERTYAAWKPSYDVPIGVSYKMTVSKSPGPYPWDYQRRPPARAQTYYRPSESSSYPSPPPSNPWRSPSRPSQSSSYPSPPSSYPSSSSSYPAPKSRGGYGGNDLDLDQMYEFKRPTYG